MAQVLRPLTESFKTEDYPQLLVGLGSPDDSAVYQFDASRAIIQTADFFPPVVDDPYAFGAIAAANALSDVYAMGGKPIMAMNLVAFPDGHDMQILQDILRGGADIVKQAGAVIAGGHTVVDKEPKYGLSVMGEVHPDHIIRKSGAQPGDKLILTKPLGTGVITTALKRGEASDEHIEHVTQGMMQLNRVGAELAQRYQVHAMTDITGYSLIGHGYEIAEASQVRMRIHFDQLQWYPGAMEYGQAEVFPGGTGRNAVHFSQWLTDTRNLDFWQSQMIFDPQTSGGLLMSVDPAEADTLLADLISEGIQAFFVGDVVADEVGITLL
ncbi:MAG: selenide, water dikinase SelD [Anaerolineaceae bacterium]|nr:selenide, water dikinase SelD [Anaerolineaceae bacterium]